MNTNFQIRIHHPDVSFARKVAGNCFVQLETLEAQLSRYRHDSDVTRINQLQAGQSLLVSDITWRCLQRSLEATALTQGLFDVTLGAQTRHPSEEPTCPLSTGRLALSPDRPEIICEEDGREIDFGGIGKGFALDEMATTLLDLGVESALLSCGASTHLAIGSHPWQMELTGDHQQRDIALLGQSLSASGTGAQGEHVIHPDTGLPPPYAYRRAWIVADTAALADALSTACLIMDDEMLPHFATSIQDRSIAIHVESIDSDEIRQIC